jgi:hypothetical protein
MKGVLVKMNNTNESGGYRLPGNFIKKHNGFFIAAASLAVIFTVIQSLLFVFYYEADLYLYETNAVLPLVFNVSAAVVIIGLLSSVLIYQKKEFPHNYRLPEANKFTVFASAVCGFIFLAVFVLGLYNILKGGDTNVAASSTVVNVFTLISVLFAAPASCYFFAIALKPEPYGNITAVLGFFVVLYMPVKLMSGYFSMDTPMNSPVRIMVQIAFMALMLFFVHDVGFSVGVTKMPYYLGFGYAALFFVPVISASAIVLNVSKIKNVYTDTLPLIVNMCLVLYIITRLVTVSRQKK